MRRNLIVFTLFAVIVIGSPICPAMAQTLSVDRVWESGVSGRIVATALSPDGLYGAVTTERMVSFYDPNGTLLWSYPVSGGRSVAVSSGGERIAAGGDHLLLFDRSGSVIWQHKSESRIQGIAIAADGDMICTGADTGLLVFSLDNGTTTANISGSFDTKDPIRSVSTDSDGTKIVAGADSGNIYFLGADGRLLWNYKTGDTGIHVALSQDGSTVAAASSQRAVYLLNRNGRLLGKSSMPGAITDVSLSEDGSRLVLADGGISILNREGEIIGTYTPGGEGRIRSVSAPSDTAHILTGAVDGTVSMFKMQPKTLSVGTPGTFLPDTFAAEPLQPSTPPAQDQTASQRGTALPLATPVAVGACAIALAWWRRVREGS
ncbi:MAG: PQQ-binding-like beta-propeller repeat protein [Methanoculleus sp.]